MQFFSSSPSFSSSASNIQPLIDLVNLLIQREQRNLLVLKPRSLEIECIREGFLNSLPVPVPQTYIR